MAECMHNYLLFGSVLQCSVMDPAKLHPDTFKNANRKFVKVGTLAWLPSTASLFTHPAPSCAVYLSGSVTLRRSALWACLRRLSFSVTLIPLLGGCRCPGSGWRASSTTRSARRRSSRGWSPACSRPTRRGGNGCESRASSMTLKVFRRPCQRKARKQSLSNGLFCFPRFDIPAN